MDTTSNEIVPSRAYSFADAAAALTICVKTLRRRVASGNVRAIPVSERRKAIPGSEILRVLNPPETK